MKTTKGKLRSITSGILHTDIGDVYKFIQEYVGFDGIMTHEIPSAIRSLCPILRTKLPEEWFSEEWITIGLEEPVELPELTEKEKDLFWNNYGVLRVGAWNAIKEKIIIITDETSTDL